MPLPGPPHCKDPLHGLVGLQTPFLQDMVYTAGFVPDLVLARRG
jgi:hypothetical protein